MPPGALFVYILRIVWSFMQKIQHLAVFYLYVPTKAIILIV